MSAFDAFQLRWPDNDVAVVQSLTPAEKVKRVRLLGYVNCLALELSD